MLNQYRCTQLLFSELSIRTARSLVTSVIDSVAGLYGRFKFYSDLVTSCAFFSQ
jgi:hypothetical protein